MRNLVVFSIYLPASISQRGITRLEVLRDDALIVGGGGGGGGEIDGGLMVNDDKGARKKRSPRDDILNNEISPGIITNWARVVLR